MNGMISFTLTVWLGYLRACLTSVLKFCLLSSFGLRDRLLLYGYSLVFTERRSDRLYSLEQFWLLDLSLRDTGLNSPVLEISLTPYLNSAVSFGELSWSVNFGVTLRFLNKPVLDSALLEVELDRLLLKLCSDGFARLNSFTVKCIYPALGVSKGDESASLLLASLILGAFRFSLGKLKFFWRRLPPEFLFDLNTLWLEFWLKTETFFCWSITSSSTVSLI